MILRSLLFLFFSQFFYAQIPVPSLVDSLAKTNSDSEKARLGMAIASQLSLEDWERALYYIDFAEESAKKSKSEKTIADFHIAEAEIYSEKGAWDITLKNLLIAYEYYKDKPLKLRYRLENDLAIAYAETENQDKALEFFHKLYNYDHTKKDPLNLASISNNIGLAWMEKDIDSSMFYFNKALELVTHIENPEFKTMLYTNLGKSATLKGNGEAAQRYFYLAINQIKRNNLSNDLPWVYGEFSELFLKNKNFDSAIYYSKKAVDIADRLFPFGVDNLNALNVLYKSYIKKGEFEKAAHVMEKYLAVSDSLNLEDQRINVQKILVKEDYRNRIKRQELEESENRAYTYLFILGLVSLLLILSIYLFQYRNKLKRTKLKNELFYSRQRELRHSLELKNKELIGKAMVEMHRSEIIEEILKDLKEIRRKTDKREIQNAIDYIGKRLKGNTSSNMWEEFEHSFEQVHQSFYQNLIKEHPDLTPKEKRLCALLKLNLTSKEIAEITGQNSKTVENARTRLRKKLEITNAQIDLSSYLSQFE